MPKKLLFTSDGYLRPGIHELSLEEVEKKFGIQNTQRILLFQKLLKGLENLKKAGVNTVYIDGSFITCKENPSDIDGCWEYEQNVVVAKIDKAFFQFC